MKRSKAKKIDKPGIVTIKEDGIGVKNFVFNGFSITEGYVAALEWAAEEIRKALGEKMTIDEKLKEIGERSKDPDVPRLLKALRASLHGLRFYECVSRDGFDDGRAAMSVIGIMEKDLENQ